MVPWLRRRRLSVSSLAFAGWARRFRRARDPGTTVARSVSGRVRRHDVAGEYGARTAEESLPLTLIGSGRALRPLRIYDRFREGFRMPARRDLSTGRGAGVRKPPRKEPA